MASTSTTMKQEKQPHTAGAQVSTMAVNRLSSHLMIIKIDIVSCFQNFPIESCSPHHKGIIKKWYERMEPSPSLPNIFGAKKSSQNRTITPHVHLATNN
jgi:hypothetical protein